MRFSRRMGDSRTIGSVVSTTKVTDAGLAQSADYWNQAWFYWGATPDVRLITDFGGGSLTLEYALAGMSAGETYEIHDFWNANDIHDAINRAIEDSWRAFPDVIVDESLIHQEDILELDLSSLSTAPWILHQIWSEINTSVIRGTADSGASTTLTDSSEDFSGVDSDWRVSIYEGTGKGQLRTVSSGTSGGVLTVSSAWTTNPDSTSKYALWDTGEQQTDWRRIPAARLDQLEFPGTLWLTQRYPALYGERIRLIYSAKPSALTTDASTTVVPSEYIIYKACSILHDQAVNSNRVDRQRHASLAEYYENLARDYVERHARQTPANTLWTESDGSGYFRTVDSADPLGWEID